jgi:hypothetical protein
MQGVVSNTGGTDAGVLPKYKKDIKIIIRVLGQRPAPAHHS